MYVCIFNTLLSSYLKEFLDQVQLHTYFSSYYVSILFKRTFSQNLTDSG